MKGTDKVTIGATESFAATVKPSAKVSYKSDATDVATVDAKGNVTGVKEGTATITATAKVGTKTVKASKKVEIVNAITAKTVSPKTISVTFAGAIEKADKANYTVTDTKGSTALIKSTTLDATKKVVTVEFYSALTSGNDYKVAVKNGEKTYEAEFKYVKGTVAAIEAEDQIVKAGVASPIVYKVVDENGLDLTDETFVSFTSTVGTITNEGKTCVNLSNGAYTYVTITYTNPTTGAQIKSKQIKVTGATSVASDITAITVGDAAVAAATAWPADKDIVTSVQMGTTKYVSALYVKSYGEKDVTSAGFKSLNPEILIVDATTGALTPIKAGTASVAVTIGNVTKTFTITVTEAPKATSLALNTKTSKVSTSLTKNNSDAYTNASLVVDVLDQNGKAFNSEATSNNLTFELTTGANVVAEFATVGATQTATAGEALSLTPKTAGTAWIKVSSNNTALAPIYVSVTVTAANDAVSSYKFVNVVNTFDLDGTDHVAKAATVKFAAVNASGEEIKNNTMDTVTGVVITLKDAAGNKVAEKTTTAADQEFTLDVTTNLTKEGTYTLTATKNGVTYDTIQITVKDSATKPVVSIKTVDYTVTNGTVPVADLFDIPTGYTFKSIKFVSSNTAVVTSNTAAAAAITLGGSKGSATLYNVELVVTNTAVHRDYTVAISTPITITVK